MSFPVGVDTTTVQAGPAFNIFGDESELTITVRPYFGSVNQIVWDATGYTFNRVAKTKTAVGEVVEFEVPVVDQAGWVDGAGNDFTMWGYEAQITATDPTDSRNHYTWRKMFQPVAADGATFDLDGVPDSTDGSPDLTPTVRIPTPGPTGPPGGSDAAQATWLRTGALSRQALADELDDATSPAGGQLLATFGAARALKRVPFPTTPVDLGTMLTPAPVPFEEKDGALGAVAWDRSWLIFGEDVQLHAVSKLNLSTYRMDRSPDYDSATVAEDGSAWYQAVTDHVTTPTGISPNSFLYGAAKESWTFVDVTGHTVETGYAIVVGTGDKNGASYRAPTVLFCREGATAAQGLTGMLATAGIMGGDTSTPRNLMGASKAAADTFYLYGSGENQSTAPQTSRPTFGRMVLTLNSAKTELGADAVSSLTWTDRLPVLQGVMPGGETIVNVPAVADKVIGSTLLVLVVTKDGANVLRARMVEFNTSNATAALDTRLDKATAGAIWPMTPTPWQDTQTASIAVGDNGILFTLCGSGGAHHAFYRGTAESTWRNVLNQAQRCMGTTAAPFQVRWDDWRNRFLLTSSSAGAGMGWLDADCKQGHYMSRLFPWRQRINGLNRALRGVCGDQAGTLVLGSHQLAAFLPDNGAIPAGSRVLWGCRVTGTANVDEVAISAGEVEVVNADVVTRLYIEPQVLSSGLTDLGDARYPHAVVVDVRTGLVNRPLDSGGSYVGNASGEDYPEPVTYNGVQIALVDRINANSHVIIPAEVNHSGAVRDL